MLYVVFVGFKFQLVIYVVVVDFGDDFFIIVMFVFVYVYDFYVLVVCFGIMVVYVEQIVGKQCGFVVVGVGVNFKECVLFIVWIFWQQQYL